MKLLLDACVLYPTVMREMLIGAADLGFFTPQWSARILEEWARAARKNGPEGETLARGEIALLQARFPRAEVAPNPGLEARLWLPDPADIHVLAAAISCSADRIVTLNKKDFPKDILAEEGLRLSGPDELLMEVWKKEPEGVQDLAEKVTQIARRLSGKDWTPRALLKKARLPRLGKAVCQD
jgi:predicted nucleic acid-binding protein